MRQNETIKANLYVLLAVLVVLAAGLATALTLDREHVPENEQAQNEAVEDESGTDTVADMETGVLGQAKKEQMDVPTQAVDAAVQPQASAETTTYALRTRDGYLQVYILETGDFYMETSIVYRLLPETVQAQIDAGKYFESEEELFEFLENYSS